MSDEYITSLPRDYALKVFGDPLPKAGVLRYRFSGCGESEALVKFVDRCERIEIWKIDYWNRVTNTEIP